MPIDPDVVVVGGGPAGVAVAIASARANLRVILFERAVLGHHKPGEILEPTIRYPLRELGLWDRFQDLGFLPIAGNLSVWDGTEPVEADAMLNPHGHGYLVDRKRMESWLIEEARQAGVQVIGGQRRIEVKEAPRCSVEWNDGGQRREARPALIVEATGRGAKVISNGRRRRLDSLIGLLVYVPDDPYSARDQRLYIEAAPEGWWYSAPLPDNWTVFALMTDVDLIPPGSESRDAFFRHCFVTTGLMRRRRTLIPRGSRIRVYPATSTRRAPICGANWIAIGDAAATYDPLSGYGVTAALAKGTALVRLIVNSPSLRHALLTYGAAEEAAYKDYLDGRRLTYRRVGRWRQKPFWERRN